MPTDPRDAAVTYHDSERIIGVVVTHRRRELLATSLGVLAARAKANEKRWSPAPNEIVANSTAVRERIRQWWGRDARVVYPPVAPPTSLRVMCHGVTISSRSVAWCPTSGSTGPSPRP